MKTLYIIYHLILTVPFVFLHTRDALLVNDFKKNLNGRSNVSDRDLEQFAVLSKKKKSGEYALAVIIIVQLLDALILFFAGFFD